MKITKIYQILYLIILILILDIGKNSAKNTGSPYKRFSFLKFISERVNPKKDNYKVGIILYNELSYMVKYQIDDYFENLSISISNKNLRESELDIPKERSLFNNMMFEKNEDSIIIKINKQNLIYSYIDSLDKDNEKSLEFSSGILLKGMGGSEVIFYFSADKPELQNFKRFNAKNISILRFYDFKFNNQFIFDSLLHICIDYQIYNEYLIKNKKIDSNLKNGFLYYLNIDSDLKQKMDARIIFTALKDVFEEYLIKNKWLNKFSKKHKNFNQELTKLASLELDKEKKENTEYILKGIDRPQNHNLPYSTYLMKKILSKKFRISKKLYMQLIII